MKGWVKFPREVVNQSWFKDSTTVHLYAYLCVTADYMTGVVSTSKRRLMSDTGLTDKSVRRALKELEKTGFIVLDKSRGNTVVNICGYSTYESGGTNKVPKTSSESHLQSRKSNIKWPTKKQDITTVEPVTYGQDKNSKVPEEIVEKSRCGSHSLKKDKDTSKPTSVALLSKNKTKQNKTKENPNGFFSEPYFDETGQVKSSAMPSLRKDIYAALGEATPKVFEDAVSTLVGDVPDVVKYIDDVITHYVLTYCTELLFTSTNNCSAEDKSTKLLNWVKVRYTGEYATTNILQDIVAYEVYEIFGKTISTDKSKRSKLRYLVKSMTNHSLDDLPQFLRYCKATKSPDVVDYLLNVSSGFQLLYHAYNQQTLGQFYRHK